MMKASTALWALLALDLAAIAMVLGVAWPRGGMVFWVAFFGLILLPWLAAYAALSGKGKPVTPESVHVREIALADESAARRQALEQAAERKEVTIAGVPGYLLSEGPPVVFLPKEGRVLRLVQAPDRDTLEQFLSGNFADSSGPVDRRGAGPLLAGAAVYTLLVACAFIILSFNPA